MVISDTATVLIVEDFDDARLMLRTFLESNGYRVAEAVNGQEAVKFVRRECPDMILMDLNMPLMDGLAATEQIRKCKEICSKVPILAITAHDTYGMRDAALEAGCDGYILKPIDFEKIEKIIRRILLAESGDRIDKQEN